MRSRCSLVSRCRLRACISSQRRSRRSSTASSCRSPTSLRSITLILGRTREEARRTRYLGCWFRRPPGQSPAGLESASSSDAEAEQLGPSPDDQSSLTKSLDQALPCPRARLDETDAAVGPEMGEGDLGKLLGDVREDADLRPRSMQTTKRIGHLGIAPEIDGCALLGEALEQLPPVRELLLQGGHVDAEAPSGILEPVAPERLDVADRAEVDGDGLHRSRTRSQISIPSATPTASIATSTGEAC